MKEKGKAKISLGMIFFSAPSANFSGKTGRIYEPRGSYEIRGEIGIIDF